MQVNHIKGEKINTDKTVASSKYDLEATEAIEKLSEVSSNI